MVVEHGHEQNPSLKLNWIYLSSVQIFLDLSENLNRCESWKIFLRELNWFSINYKTILRTRWIVGNTEDVLST